MSEISYERLLEIARKMHLYIFLHSDNEQEIYDELELTEEENTVLGYSGQIILEGSDKDIPGFEGTLEALDNLSIRGNNDK